MLRVRRGQPGKTFLYLLTSLKSNDLWSIISLKLCPSVMVISSSNKCFLQLNGPDSAEPLKLGKGSHCPTYQVLRNFYDSVSINFRSLRGFVAFGSMLSIKPGRVVIYFLAVSTPIKVSAVIVLRAELDAAFDIRLKWCLCSWTPVQGNPI